MHAYINRFIKIAIYVFSPQGHETKAMLNNSGPRYKRSKLERRMNINVFFCVGLLFIMCLIGALGLYFKWSNFYSLSMWDFCRKDFQTLATFTSL